MDNQDLIRQILRENSGGMKAANMIVKLPPDVDPYKEIENMSDVCILTYDSGDNYRLKDFVCFIHRDSIKQNILEFLPHASFEIDNTGQILIYTGEFVNID